MNVTRGYIIIMRLTHRESRNINIVLMLNDYSFADRTTVPPPPSVFFCLVNNIMLSSLYFINVSNFVTSNFTYPSKR